MPEEERTQFATPIALRPNESDASIPEQPNPYTRLEALEAVRERVAMLRQAAEEAAMYPRPALSPDPDAGLEHVLRDLEHDLAAALHGPLLAVTAVKTRGRRTWLQLWAERLWPTR